MKGLFDTILDEFNVLGEGSLSDDPEAIFKGASSPHIGLWRLWAYAETFRRRQNWSRALDWAQSCDSIVKRVQIDPGPTWRAEFLGSTGQVLLAIGEIATALQILWKANEQWRSLFEELHTPPPQQPYPLTNAVRDMYEALTDTHSRKLPLDNQELIVAWLGERLVGRRHNVVCDLIRCLSFARQTEQAHQVADELIEWLPLCVEPASLPHFLYGVYMALGNMEQDAGRTEAAIAEFERAIAVYEHVDSNFAIGKLSQALFNKANGLLRLGRTSEVRSIYQQLQRNFENLGDREAALRVRYADLYAAWISKSADPIESKLRTLIADYEAFVADQRDAANYHVHKQNLEQAYRLLLTLIATKSTPHTSDLHECLRLVTALREPQYLAGLRSDKADDTDAMEQVNLWTGVLVARLSKLPRTLLLILESGIDCLILIGLRNDGSGVEGQIVIAAALQNLTTAVIDLITHTHTQVDALIARSISAQQRAPAALGEAGHRVWQALPPDIRTCIAASSTIFFSPSAFGAIDELPIELVHTDEMWLGLSHVVVRAPSLIELARTLAPNGVPRALTDRAYIYRAEDPPDLDTLVSADEDAQIVHRAMKVIGLTPTLEIEPAPRHVLQALDQGYRVLHYVGHGLASDLGEELPVTASASLHLQNLEQLSGYRTPFVYLSACLVGRARHLQGGKQRGFGIALLAHGAPAVIASAYPVPDHVCAEVAKAFYRSAWKLPAGEALRHARQSLDKAGMHPVAWSSFILQGDPHYTITPAAGGSIDGSRILTTDWPAHLARYLASHDERDREACLDALSTRSQQRGEQADLLDKASTWIRAALAQDRSTNDAQHEQIANLLMSHDHEAGATLLMLLAMERIELRDSDISTVPQEQLRREIGRGLSLAIHLDDAYAFVAFAAAHADMLTLDVRLSESARVLQAASRFAAGLRDRDTRFAAIEARINAVLQQWQGKIIIDLPEGLGMDADEWQQFEKAIDEDRRNTRISLPAQGLSWPALMIRYVAANSKPAFDDLRLTVASGIEASRADKDELKAVYDLLRYHNRREMVPDLAYRRVLQFLDEREQVQLALQAFRLHDRIASDPKHFTNNDVTAGLAVAETLGHSGLHARFTMLQAQRAYEHGDISTARILNLQALEVIRALVARDDAYTEQFGKTELNSATFCTLDGDFATARMIAAEVQARGGADLLGRLAEILLGPAPEPTVSFTTADEMAASYLESGDNVRALEWYNEVERIGRAQGDEMSLCGLLGDKAVAFRRLGNMQRAIDTYNEVIALCRKHHDWTNLSRWSQNLALILMDRDDYPAANMHLKEGMQAALRSGDSRQISTATGNYAALLNQQGRYQEAAEMIEQVLAAAPEEPWLQEQWRTNARDIYRRWGDRLAGEGQAAEALKAYIAALDRADGGDRAEQREAAILLVKITALHERMNNLEQARASAKQAISLFHALGDQQAVARLEELLKGGPTLKLTDRDEAPDDAIARLRSEVKRAVAAPEVEAEATARMNLCAALLNRDDDQATAMCEETLALVRRLQDRRRELILCLNFTPHLLSHGQARRAMTLANRALALSERGMLAHRVIALLNSGRVWVGGFNEAAKAMDAFRTAFELLEHHNQSSLDAGSALQQLRPFLTEIAQTVQEIGSPDDVEMLLKLLEPEAVAKIAQARQHSQEQPPAPTIAALRDISYPALDPILAAWRSSNASPDQGELDKDASNALERMQGFAEIAGWAEAHDRPLARPIVGSGQGASRGGCGGLLQLAELVAQRKLDYKAAQQLAAQLTLPDDELTCVVLYASQDDAMSRNGIAFTLLQVGALLASSPRLSSRLYALMALFTQSSGDNPRALAFLKAAESRLEGGIDDAERARLRNEIAVVLAAMGQLQESYEQARDARSLAEAARVPKLAAMATGNMGYALMQMRHFEAALAIFEQLAEVQRTLGDLDGLSATQHNIATCYMALGHYDRAHFDETTADPDSLFNQATSYALRDNYDKALELYARAVAAIGALEAGYPHEADMRESYARTLYSAGLWDDAIEQMKLAAAGYERQSEATKLHGAYSWMAAATVRDPSVAVYYAERGLALGRALGQKAEIVVDLGQLAQAYMTVNRYADAIGLLEEACALANDPDTLATLQITLADALVGAGRASEAIPLFQSLYERAASTDDIESQIHSLFGLAEAHQRISDFSASLPLLREAYALASSLEPSEISVQAINRLGLALLRTNQEEAAQLLETGVELAQQLGLRHDRLVLLNNLSSAYKETGNLDRATATLRQVRVESRASGERGTEVIALAQLGDIFARQRQHHEALTHYLEAADLAQELGDAHVEATCLDAVGISYANLGQPESAVEYHRRAVRLYVQQGAYQDQLIALINLANVYILLNDLDQAQETVREALELAARYEVDEGGLSMVTNQIAALRGHQP